MYIVLKKHDHICRSEDTYLLLRQAVKTLYGIDMPYVEKTTDGKPYFPESPDIFFSISHSGKYGLCAVSSFPIGADVQVHKKVSPSLPRRVCTEGELSALDFFTLWTLKESYIKLRGKKTFPYSKIEFSAENGSISCFDGDIFCRSWNPFSDCSVAVCSSCDNFPEKIIIT